jgi:hypothetical protein
MIGILLGLPSGRWSGCNGGWIKYGNRRVSSEVGYVEGQEMAHAVDRHRRNQARVVSLFAADGEGGDKTFPFRIDGSAIGEKGKQRLEASEFACRLGNGQTKPVVRRGPGRDHPELVEDLRNHARLIAPTVKGIDGGDGIVVLRVCGLGQPAKDVCVNENVHSRSSP